jgi:hypothetical protein
MVCIAISAGISRFKSGKRLRLGLYCFGVFSRAAPHPLRRTRCAPSHRPSHTADPLQAKRTMMRKMQIAFFFLPSARTDRCAHTRNDTVLPCYAEYFVKISIIIVAQAARKEKHILKNSRFSRTSVCFQPAFRAKILAFLRFNLAINSRRYYNRYSHLWRWFKEKGVQNSAYAA